MQSLKRRAAIDFVAARRAWFAEAETTGPFASADWALHFLDQVAEDDWTIVVPESQVDGGGLMLLYARPDQPGQLHALTNYYASLFAPMVSPSADRSAVATQLVAELTARRCAVVDLMPLDAEAQDTAALRAAFTARGWFVKPYFCFGNWYLPCDGLSFKDYMAGRDSRMTNTWQRKAKKFFEKKPADPANAANAARLQIITAPEEVDAGIDAYEQVYHKSWKKPEPYPAFIRGWARISAQKGWLRLGIAWIGDVPVAAQLWFTLHRKAYIFKLAYDEDYSKWSAGTVLTAHLFQQALDVDKVIEIDYLTGDDAYKKSWMTHRRERVGLLACNPRTLSGLLLAGRERAASLWKRLRPAPVAPATAAAPAATATEDS